MRRVTILGADRQVPGRWTELQGLPFVRVHLARLLPGAEGRRLGIVLALLKVHWRHDVRMWLRWHLRMNGHDMASLLPLADPFVDPAPLNTWQLPRLAVRLRRFHRVHAVFAFSTTRPLDTMSAEHWGEVDAHFMRWQATMDLDHVRAMAALLYQTDARAPYTYEQLREGIAIPLANAMRESVLLAVAANWGQLRSTLEKLAPHVFIKGTQQKAKASGGWGHVLMAAAGGKLGTWEQTRSTPVRPFLVHLNQAITDAKNAKHRRKAGTHA